MRPIELVTVGGPAVLIVQHDQPAGDYRAGCVFAVHRYMSHREAALQSQQGSRCIENFGRGSCHVQLLPLMRDIVSMFIRASTFKY